MFSDFVVSIIRTVVPTLAGFVVAILVYVGVDADSTEVASFLTAVFTGVYYVVARFLETKYPRFGWLLGAPKQPTYGTTDG